MCLCKPGYEYYDENEQLYAEDSIDACIPVVQVVCVFPQVRLGSVCVDPVDVCTASCAVDANGTRTNGVYNSQLAMCECTFDDLDTVCDSQCRDTSATVRVGTDGSLIVTNPATGATTSTSTADVPGYFGKLNCGVGDDCALLTVIVSGESHKAVYGAPPSIEAVQVAASAGRQLKALGGTRDGKHFSTLAANLIDALPGYKNPTVCLKAGSGILFELTSKGSYPVYMKDSNLNSNDDFDYSLFRELGARVGRGHNISTFGFTFQDPGVYAFTDNADTTIRDVYVVVKKTQNCPTAGAIMGTSASTLVSLGVSKQQTFVLAPNMWLVLGLVALFAMLTAVVAVYARLKMARAQRLRKTDNLEEENSGNNFRLLYLELMNQTNTREMLLKSHEDNFRAQVNRICGETEQLKALLSVKMSDGQGFIQAAWTLFSGEVAARDVFNLRQNRREDMCAIKLATLATQLKTRPLSSPDVLDTVEDIIKSIVEIEEQDSSDRLRRQQASGSSAIIGEDIMAEMLQHEQELSDETRKLVSPLVDFRAHAERFRKDLLNLTNEYDDRIREAEDRHVSSGALGLIHQQQAQAASLAERLLVVLAKLLPGLTTQQNALKDVRKAAKEASNSAWEMLERRKAEVEKDKEEGIFRGLSDELAAALRLFLGQAAGAITPAGGLALEVADNASDNDADRATNVPARAIEIGESAESLAALADEEHAKFEARFNLYKNEQLENQRKEMLDVAKARDVGENLSDEDRMSVANEAEAMIAKNAKDQKTLEAKLEVARLQQRAELDAKLSSKRAHREAQLLLKKLEARPVSKEEAAKEVDRIMDDWKAEEIRLKKEELVAARPSLLQSDSVQSAEIIADQKKILDNYTSVINLEADRQRALLQSKLALRETNKKKDTSEDVVAKRKAEIESQKAGIEDEDVLNFLQAVESNSLEAKDIMQMYMDMHKKNGILDVQIREEHVRQGDLTDKYLEEDISDMEDREALGKAKADLRDCFTAKDTEESELVSAIREKERAGVEMELAKVAKLEQEFRDDVHSLEEESMYEQARAKTEAEKADIAAAFSEKIRKLEETFKHRQAMLHMTLARTYEQTKANIKKERAELEARYKARVFELQEVLRVLREHIKSKQTGDVDDGDIQSLEDELNGAGTKSSREEAQEKFNQQQQKDLLKQHQDEEQKLNDELELNRQEEVEAFENSFEEFKEQEVATREAQLKNEMKNADKARMEELLASHASVLTEFKANLTTEKGRQMSLLDEKIALRKKQRKDRLKKGQDEQIKEEVHAQERDKELSTFVSMQKREEEIIRKLLTPTNRYKGKGIIEKVLRPRHQKEMMNVLHENLQEVTSKFNEALSKAFGQVAVAREELETRCKAGEFSEKKLLQLKEELEGELDQKGIREQVASSLQAKHDAALESLRNNQKSEVKTLFLKCFADETFESPEWTLDRDQVQRMMLEMEAKRTEQEEELQAQVKALEAKQTEFKLEMEEKRQQQMADFEASVEEENAKLLANLDEEMAQKRADAAQQKKAKQLQLEAELKASGGSSSQRAEELRKDVDEAEGEARRAEEEAFRSRLVLEAELATKKEEARKAELGRLNAEMRELQDVQKREKQDASRKLLATKEERTMKIKQLIQESGRKFYKIGLIRSAWRQRSVELALKKFKHAYRVGAPALQRKLRRKELGFGGGDGGGGAGDGEGGFVDGAFPGTGAQGQSFLTKLAAIESQVFKIAKAQGHEASTDSPFGGFVDAVEASLTVTGAGTRPTACVIASLGPTQFVLYRYGIMLLEFLNRNSEQPPMTLLLASTIPASPQLAGTNAFAKSYFWDSKSRTIFVRLERTLDAGTFTLVLAHIVSHVHADQWADDHPQFNEAFYASLRCLCSELFFGRVRTMQPGAEDRIDQQSSTSMQELREAFSTAQGLEGKQTTVENFLELQAIPSSRYDPADAVEEMLVSSEGLAADSTLQSFLRRVEAEIAHASDDEGEGDEEETEEANDSMVHKDAEILRDRSDALNVKLLTVLREMKDASQRIIELEDTGGRADHAQRVEEWSDERRAVRDILVKLHAQKEALVKRLQDTEKELREAFKLI
jgi:hypothetical protein